VGSWSPEGAPYARLVTLAHRSKRTATPDTAAPHVQDGAVWPLGRRCESELVSAWWVWARVVTKQHAWAPDTAVDYGREFEQLAHVKLCKLYFGWHDGVVGVHAVQQWQRQERFNRRD
jgi:hypothetical protein